MLFRSGAGFGYLGSTITSLIYASFTFIFFALEAAVMAYALELAFDIPPAWGYGLCALVVLPPLLMWVDRHPRIASFGWPHDMPAVPVSPAPARTVPKER